MQRLEFEAAWDKTIAPQDRKNIEDIFNNHPITKEQGVDFIFLWEATNHRGDLLVAVLIENYNDHEWTMKDVPIQYNSDSRDPVTSSFSLPFTMEKKTTMPWTFIYSQPYKSELASEFKITES